MIEAWEGMELHQFENKELLEDFLMNNSDKKVRWIFAESSHLIDALSEMIEW